MPKTDIHPQYFTEAAITCTCGATHAMGSTKDALRLDICSNCHPFYSGNQKLIDTAGRVDRFREKMATAQAMGKVKSKKEKVKSEEAGEETPVVEDTTEEVTEAPAEEVTETESNEEIKPSESEEGSDEEVVAADEASDDAGKEAE